MTKYFAILKDNVIVGREGGYSAGASTHYGYKRLNAAQKFADKVGGEVVSIQGQHFNGLQNECDHFDLRLDATRQFCAPKNGLR
tara:strand:+ start:415 stop:666 length:252 start_codon:yes stop_codon:yes gene_type:complete